MLRLTAAAGALMALLTIASAGSVAHAGPNTFVVNTTDDTDDTVCDAAHCSLREAADAAFPGGGTITFDIPATDPGYDAVTGVWSIQLTDTIPISTATIEGPSQAVNRGDTNPSGPEIAVDGSLLGDGFTCVKLFDDTTLRGVIVSQCSTYPVWAEGENISVVGNLIGAGTDGNQVGDAGNSGVLVIRAHDVIVGGANPEDRNIIHGAGQAIRVSTDSADTLIIGNEIADNGTGVKVHAQAIRATISANSIHSNTLAGIEIEPGSNGDVSPPVITGLGSVSGTACANCTVEVFSDNEDEGRFFEGATAADGAGNWTLNVDPAGPNVTATATDSNGNTSAFSAPVTLGPQFTQGDNDCDGDSDAVDALVSLQSNAGFPYSQQPDCIGLGSAVPAGVDPQLFGDIDCDGDVDAVDALQILLDLAGLPVNQQQGCTPIGQPL